MTEKKCEVCGISSCSCVRTYVWIGCGEVCSRTDRCKPHEPEGVNWMPEEDYELQKDALRTPLREDVDDESEGEA